MVTISTAAALELSLMVSGTIPSKDHRGDVVMRLQEVDGGICLLHDARRPGDVVFTLEGPGLLCIDKRLADELASRTLELREDAYEAAFALVG